MEWTGDGFRGAVEQQFGLKKFNRPRPRSPRSPSRTSKELLKID
jgi:hypothetical protein